MNYYIGTVNATNILSMNIYKKVLLFTLNTMYIKIDCEVMCNGNF